MNQKIIKLNNKLLIVDTEENEDQRNKTQLENTKRNNAKKIQELSLELVVKIFSYLNLSQMPVLNTECRLFRHAVALNTKDRLLYRKNQLDRVIDKIQKQIEKLSVNTIRKIQQLMQLKFLQSDFLQMYSLVWRFMNNLHAWSYLSRLILPIIDEIETELKNIMEYTFYESRTGSIMVHPILQKFLLMFDEIIEHKILDKNLVKNCIFIKLIDMISLSYINNFEIKYYKDSNNTNVGVINKIDLNFQVRASPETTTNLYLSNKRFFEDIYTYFNPVPKEISIMKSFQRFIRLINMNHCNNLCFQKGLTVWYKMDDRSFVYLKFGSFSGGNMLTLRKPQISLTINNILNRNETVFQFNKTNNYETPISGLFGIISTNCPSDYQPVAFEELHKHCLSSLNSENYGPKNYEKSNRTRNNSKNEFGLSLIEHGFGGRKLVREISFNYS